MVHSGPIIVNTAAIVKAVRAAGANVGLIIGSTTGGDRIGDRLAVGAGVFGAVVGTVDVFVADFEKTVRKTSIDFMNLFLPKNLTANAALDLFVVVRRGHGSDAGEAGTMSTRPTLTPGDNLTRVTLNGLVNIVIGIFNTVNTIWLIDIKKFVK